MVLNGIWQVFLVGCFGGIILEAVKWYGLRESANMPVYIKSAPYWAITIIMVLIGGGLAIFYGTVNVDPLLVVNIGASAPVIISALGKGLTSKPVPPAGTPVNESFAPPHKVNASMLNFISGR
ncbi:MAG: hypothetical protein WCH85_10560 [Methanomicrobiales archaeon]